MSPDPKSQSYCRSCGQRLVAGAAFCRQCGAAIRPAAPAGAATPPTVPAATPGEPPTQPLPEPQRPAQPAPPSSRPPRRWWRAVLIAALAGLLVGGGVAAAIVLLGGDDSKQASGPVPGSAATVPAGAGEVTSSGESTSPGAPPGFPAKSTAQMAQDIQAVLLAFHEDVVAERFRDAWSLQSARKRTQYLREQGYAKWKKNQDSLTPYLSPAGLTVRIDDLEGDGVARVLLTGMGWSEPGSSCSEWSGLTWVRYEGGRWTYDPGYSTTADRQRAWKPRIEELLGVGC